MLNALQYQVLRRLRPEDPPYMMAATAYQDRSKLESLCGELLENVSQKTVLDFGCGDGLEALELARRGAARVYGVDTNLGCVEIAQWYANQAGISDVTEFSTDVNDVPKASVDLAIAIDSFEHFSDPAAVLRLLYDLLRPGGALIVSFGPPWYHPYGGHLFSVFPWAHLVFSEAALIRWREDRRDDRPKTFAESGLNGMTVARFERLVRATPFHIELLEALPIRRLRRLYTPLTRELFTSVVRCKLRKLAAH